MATVLQESTITEQLKALIYLQYVDSRIDQTNKLRGDLPEEVGDLEDEIAGLNTRLEKYQAENKEGDVQRRKSDLDIAESEALIKRYEEQQLQVRNNREYDALTKEIEAQRQRIADANLLIQSMGARDEANNLAIQEAQDRLKQVAEILKEKKKELQVVIEDTEQEQAMLADKHNEAETKIEDRYLRAYKRLRSRLRDGRAVVPLERGAAGGFAVTPQRQVEIKQGNRIVVCEHTGRIIVDETLFEDTVKDIDF